MVIVIRKISDLKAADYNPNTMTAKDRENLSAGLKKFGMVDPVVVNKHPDRMDILVGGHHRTEEWEKLGNEEIPTVEVNLPLELEKELNVRLNKNRGKLDKQKLTSFFQDVQLIDWGFDVRELADMKPLPELVPPPQEENYNLRHTLIFKSVADKEKFDDFLKRLATKYPEEKKIADRVIRHIQEQTA